MPAKIVVTNQTGGSRVTLIGSSGKQLLASELFGEPRAKGATVRALKGLLGSQVIVEDNTLSAGTTAGSKRALNGKKSTPRGTGLKTSSVKRSASTRALRTDEAETASAPSERPRARRRSRQTS